VGAAKAVERKGHVARLPQRESKGAQHRCLAAGAVGGGTIQRMRVARFRSCWCFWSTLPVLSGNLLSRSRLVHGADPFRWASEPSSWQQSLAQVRRRIFLLKIEGRRRCLLVQDQSNFRAPLWIYQSETGTYFRDSCDACAWVGYRSSFGYDVHPQFAPHLPR